MDYTRWRVTTNERVLLALRTQLRIPPTYFLSSFVYLIKFLLMICEPFCLRFSFFSQHSYLLLSSTFASLFIHISLLPQNNSEMKQSFVKCFIQRTSTTSSSAILKLNVVGLSVYSLLMLRVERFSLQFNAGWERLTYRSLVCRCRATE